MAFFVLFRWAVVIDVKLLKKIIINGGAMSRKIIIISAGRLGDVSFFRERLAAMKDYLLICCDGGVRHLDELDTRPDVIVGDMDSADAVRLAKYMSGGARVLRYPPDKDATDTQLALEHAYGIAPETIEIWGALGGRIDHTLANLFLLGFPGNKGIKISLVDEYCEVFIAEKKVSWEKAVGHTVSLFAWGARAEDVTLQGFRYPLSKETLEVNDPRGVSNVIVDSPATLQIGFGALLVIRYWQKDYFPEAV